MNNNKYAIEIHNKKILKLGIDATIDFFTILSTKTIRKDKIIAFATQVDSPFLNFILDRGNDKKNIDLLIGFAKQFFGELKVAWSWLIPPDVKNNLLNYNGFHLIDESPALYFDLSILVESSKTVSHIEQVQNIGDLKNWIIPIAEQFQAADGGEKFGLLNASLFSNKRLLHFVALYEGKIASSATLFLSDDAVMLHNLATKSEFKNRGIATELTLHMMKFAKSLRYKHCYLDSSEEAFSLYKRLGFKVYGTSKIYIMNADTNLEI